jgi:hypothetical protein
MAEATIPLAGALRLGFITLRANNSHLGDLLVLPLHRFHPIVGQETTRDKQLCPRVLLAQQAYSNSLLFFRLTSGAKNFKGLPVS